MNCNCTEFIYIQKDSGKVCHIGKYCRECRRWVKWVSKEEFIANGYELTREPKEESLFSKDIDTY